MNAAKSVLHRTVLMAAIGAALASCASAATFTREEIREIDAASLRKLAIEVDSGDILVAGSADQTISARIVLTVRASNQETADRSFASAVIGVQQSGDSARIIVKSASRKSFWSRFFGPPTAESKLVLQCPNGIDLDVKTGAGDFIVQNLKTNLNYRSGAGDASISKFSGALNLTSGAGDLTATGSIHAFTIKSGAGDITISSDIPVTADSRISSGAGNVSLRLPATAAFTLDASTGVGTVSCEFPVDPGPDKPRKSLKTSINGGGPWLVLKSGAGDVSLRQGPHE